MTNKELLLQIEQALKNKGYSDLQPEALFAPIAYTLGLGGKRVRPLLCLLAYRLYRDDHHKAMPIAIALEIFHNFTLLHDDLMDKSSLRRGKATVYRAWSENIAILSGDAMSIEAYRALEGLASAELLQKVLPIFNQMAIDICRGQQYDMLFEEREDVSVEEYMEMIRLKTAVLLGAALRLGALAAGQTDEEAQKLDHIGQALGLAFQIQDDYLDVYGDEATFGKPIGGDIINAKKTLMLLYSLEQLKGQNQGQDLEALMRLATTEREPLVERIRTLYTLAGAECYAQEQIQRLSNEAKSLLLSLNSASERLQPLLQLFDKLSSRQN